MKNIVALTCSLLLSFSVFSQESVAKKAERGMFLCKEYNLEFQKTTIYFEGVEANALVASLKSQLLSKEEVIEISNGPSGSVVVYHLSSLFPGDLKQLTNQFGEYVDLNTAILTKEELTEFMQ